MVPIDSDWTNKLNIFILQSCVGHGESVDFMFTCVLTDIGPSSQRMQVPTLWLQQFLRRTQMGMESATRSPQEMRKETLSLTAKKVRHLFQTNVDSLSVCLSTIYYLVPQIQFFKQLEFENHFHPKKEKHFNLNKKQKATSERKSLQPETPLQEVTSVFFQMVSLF